MTDDGRDNEALVAFLGALALAILELDNPKTGDPSSGKLLFFLDDTLAETPPGPGGPELRERIQVLRGLLVIALERASNLKKLAEEVNEIFDPDS